MVVCFAADVKISCMLINCIKAEVANLLIQAGYPPKVLTAGAIVGTTHATELFQAAYDEHAHRIAKMYQNLCNLWLKFCVKKAPSSYVCF